MINHLRVIAVLPAYNAAKTLEKTFREIPSLVDEVILCDDNSKDNTIEVARTLGIKHILVHNKNRGYGGNQKSLFDKALELNGDIIILLHPDYQYTPLLIPSIAHMIATGIYPVVFASRILGLGALKGGMPIYKYVSNRFLTLFQNWICGNKLSEYHTGYRAYSADVLRSIDYQLNSDDFIFDNQIIVQIFNKGYAVGEISCPTKYFEEASSINFSRSMKYGIGVLWTSIQYRLHKWGIYSAKYLK